MELPKTFISETEKSFQYQDSLPPLPLPDLNNTLQKYLDSVKAVATPEEYRQTEFVVQQFASGVGKDLQNAFIDKYKNHRNWLEELWENKAYLEWREPSSPLVNIAGAGPYFMSDWPPKDGTQIERAAFILYATLKYWEIIRKEKLPVDRGGRTTVWCMNQYKRLFNSCKTPGLTRDKLNFHFKASSEGVCPDNMVIMCRGRLFSFPCLDQSGEIITVPELQLHLQAIRDKCDQEPEQTSLGPLTAANRTIWAENYNHLMELHPENKHNFELIQKSVLMMTLDERSPSQVNKIFHGALAGDCRNRWADKAVNMIVFKNGVVTGNCDHAPFDGIVYIYTSYFGALCIEQNQGKWQGSKEVRDLPPPKELVFHVDDSVRKASQLAQINYQKLADNIDIVIDFYKGYGKKFIRSYKLHPDSYVQMALQLAYYRLYNKAAPTYETAPTRKYWHGRTETVRSCTVEAIRWAKSMLDPTASKEKRLRFFLAAIGKHNQSMAESSDSKGCDRHLLALGVLAGEMELPIPQIFTDPCFVKSGGGGNYILSTSFVGYSTVVGGCAPMCRHGYGFFYSIQQDQISCYVTSWVEDQDTEASRLYASMKQTLDELRTLLETTTPQLTNKL